MHTSVYKAFIVAAWPCEVREKNQKYCVVCFRLDRQVKAELEEKWSLEP